ncbi:MAG TPA: AsmA family protein, partial [bacterium (Candidatus Stahlbacteria)]|nr:AsmA family protein [Candidatus Stahlbacteria bacterium]
MKRIGCIIVIIVGGIIIAGFLLIRNYLTDERLTTVTRDFLNRTFNRTCEVKRVSLRFGFGIKIGIDDIRVPNLKGYEEKNLLEIDDVSLQVSLLPLIFRKIEISRAEFTGPRVSIERRKDGKMNLPPLPAGKAEGPGFTIDLQDVKINDGLLVFKDHQTRKTFLIQNLDQVLKGTDQGFDLLGHGRFFYQEKMV